VDAVSGGSRVLLIPNAFAAQATADGSWLYFTRADRPGLWRAPSARLEAVELIVDAVPMASVDGWLVTPQGVYFVARAPGIGPRHVPLAGGGATDVAQLTNLSWPGITLTPEGAHLLYARWDRRESNIMAVEASAR
jgi:hypothetical protein